MKLLSGIQYKAKERKRQVTTIQQTQVTTFQLPEATQATTGFENILTISDTQQVSTQVVQPSQVAAPQPPTVIAKVQPQRSSSVSSQSASYVVVDDQQSKPSRQLMFALSPTKTFIFIYLGFNTALFIWVLTTLSTHCIGHIMTRSLFIEETSTYSWSRFCTLNCRSTASNYQLSQTPISEVGDESVTTLPLWCHPSPQDNLRTVSTTLLDYQAFSGVFHPYCSTNRLIHHNHFHPLNFNQHRHQCQLPLSKDKQDLSASPANRIGPNQQISLFLVLIRTAHTKKTLLKASRIFPKHLIAMLFSQNKNKYTVQHTHIP